MKHDDLTAVWKALADPTRRQLLDLLRERPRTTGELADAFPTSRFAVMKHLGVLERAGLVLARKEGRQVWHHLNAVPLRRVYERWVHAYADQWASSLMALKDTAEGGARAGEMGTGGNTSMNIEQEVTIAASPERVFEALTRDVGAWWSHSFAESPRGIHLEPRVGGRFYEEFDGDGNGALYATVTYVEQGKSLRMSGPMGMAGAVLGAISYELEARDGGTLLKLSHRATGDLPDGALERYAGGWQEMLNDRLKRYIEAGA